MATPLGGDGISVVDGALLFVKFFKKQMCRKGKAHLKKPTKK